ncbi:MAG: Holliday junction branch migration protein RuvA [Acidimicrobiales bacterium]
MIGSLRGTVLERVPGPTSGELLLEVGGVGYQVAVPTGTLAQAEPGAAMFVHVHTHVREDAIILFGFATRAERRCFDALLGVHGVGPSLALALLSTHGPAALNRIVVTDDADALTLVPGVGKKTAVRLLMELRSRFDVLDLSDGGPALDARPGTVDPDPRSDVRSALAGLGYGADEVMAAMRALPDDVDPSTLLRHALRQLARSR